MQAILEHTRADLAWFVEQRDHLVMVLSCSPTEVPYATKVLEVVEAEHPSDLFVLFADNVEADDDAHGWVTRLLDNLEAQRGGVNQVRILDRRAPWPPLPDACADLRLAPGERLRLALEWLRGRIPDTRHRLVLGLLPVDIANPTAYASVVRTFLPGDELPPWSTGVRIILRDDRAAPILVPHLEREPSDWVIVHEGLDLSPETLSRALVDQVGRRGAPPDERAVAMVQLAALDFSHRRHAASLEKWGGLFAYYRERDVPQMQALCLCGAADVLRATGKLPEAKAKYQQGLAYTTTVEHLPVMLNLLLGVGETCIALGHWQEAEGYLALADRIADTTRLLHPRCDIMGRRAVALLALGRTLDAYTQWRACADVSRAIAYYPRCIEALASLIELRRRATQSDEVRRLETELDEVEAEARA